MVTKGVIAPVIEPTEWVSQMVVTQKKDSDAIQNCIDPKDLNEAIQKEHCPIGTFGEVVARMRGILQRWMLLVDFGRFLWIRSQH